MSAETLNDQQTEKDCACNWNKPNIVCDEKILDGYKNILISFVSKITNLDPSEFSSLSIVTATNYHAHKLLVKDIAIERKFEFKQQKTKKTHLLTGDKLNKSNLWEIRSDLLKSAEKQKNHNLLLPETLSTINCSGCNGSGYETCSVCKGEQKITCKSCHGSGIREIEEEVPCPLCSGHKRLGWSHSSPCQLCGKEFPVKKTHNGVDYTLTKTGKSTILLTGGGNGTVLRHSLVSCEACDGLGKKKCTNCTNGQEICHICDGSGKFETVWSIKQQIFAAKENITNLWIEEIPIELKEVFCKKSENIFERDSNTTLVKNWHDECGFEPGDIFLKSGKVNIAQEENLKINTFHDVETINLIDLIEKSRYKNLADYESYIVSEEYVCLYEKPVFVQIIFKYLDKSYCVWIDIYNEREFYEFSHDGFFAAWKRSQAKYLKSLNFVQRIFQKKINYLEILPDYLTDKDKSILPNKLFAYSLEIHPIATKCKTQHSKHQQDSLAVTPIVTKCSSKKLNRKDECKNGNEEIVGIPDGTKSKNIYALLAIALPGVHNIYAGYLTRGIIQLLIAILSVGVGLCITWPWSVIEASCIKRDAKANEMRSGFMVWIARILLFLICVGVVKAIIDEKISKKTPGTTVKSKQEQFHDQKSHLPSHMPTDNRIQSKK